LAPRLASRFRLDLADRLLERKALLGDIRLHRALTSNSIDELEGLGSDLTSAVRQLQEFLKSEGERVQREIVNYAHLTETTLAAIKNIIETTFRPRARATRPRVD
jgi:hypothetical protein